MTKLDLTLPIEDLTVDLIPVLRGVECATILSPVDEQIGYLYVDGDEFCSDGVGDLLTAIVRRAGESDIRMAVRLARWFERTILTGESQSALGKDC